MPNSKYWAGSSPLSPSVPLSLKIHFCNKFKVFMWQENYAKVSSEARGIESPGAGFTGGWELPDVGAGNPIQVFHKHSVCSS